MRIPDTRPGEVALLPGLIYTHGFRLGGILLKHLNVLSMVFVLLIGAWAIFYFQQKSRRFHDAGLRDFLRFMLIFNLYEFTSFILIYFYYNLTPAQLGDALSLLKGIHWPLGTLLLMGFYFYQYKIIAWQRERELPRWLKPALFSFTGGLMAFFLLAMRFPAFLPKGPLLTFWNLYLWPLTILEIIWLAKLLAESRRRTDPGHKRAGMALAWLFLCHILLQMVIFVLSATRFENWNMFLSRLLILYTNFIPVFWLKYYYIPWAGALSKIINSGGGFDSLQRTHGLSARELEVFKLVIDGKSYKQIEELLFISIHTVKSHIYSLYRKMNVKNRQQLVHLASTFQQENS